MTPSTLSPACRPTRRMTLASANTSTQLTLGTLRLQLDVTLDLDGLVDGKLYRVFDDGVTPVACLEPGVIETVSAFFLNEEEKLSLLVLFTQLQTQLSSLRV